MAWLVLVVAGLLEVVWALGLPKTQGFTKLWPSIVTATAIVASMFLLSRAAKTIPIGTAYPVWVGIGAVGAALAGVVRKTEPTTTPRLFFLAMLIVAIVGLKATSRAE